MIRSLRSEFPGLSLHRMAQILGVSRASAYRLPQKSEKIPGGVMESVALERPGYGYRRMMREIQARGFMAGEHTVRRQMKELGLSGLRRRRRRPPKASPTQIQAQNLLKCGGLPQAPVKAFAGDTTEIWTSQGRVHLAVLIDLHTRQAHGWSLSRQCDTFLALDCLDKMFKKAGPQKGWIHHSDRGSIYTASEYRSRLKDLGARESFSPPGTPQENGFMESFFSRLKEEEVTRNSYQSILEAEASLSRFIEYYNHTRMHSSLNYLSPDQFNSLQSGGREP